LDYKNHIKIDAKSKVLNKFKVTDGGAQDSQVIDNLIYEDDK